MWFRSRTRWLLLAATLAAAGVIVAARVRPSRQEGPPRPVSATPPPPPRFTAPPPPPRFEDDQRWNRLYGKVLSGTGTIAEIDAYYDHLRERSQRAANEAQDLLGQRLGDRERALAQLALRINRERLARLPRERELALARRQLQEERRRSWTTMAPRP